MAPKPPSRPVIEIGVTTTDWSRSILDDQYRFVLGGAGWVRFGQCSRSSMNRMVIGDLTSTMTSIGVRPHSSDYALFPSVVFMQRYMEDRVSSMVAAAVKNGQAVINDVDDWFWGLHDENQAKNLVDPLLNPRSNVDHYRRTLEASSLVTVSTPFLLEKMKGWGLPSVLVENCVSVHMFTPRRHRQLKPIVGWAGSTAHRSGDLEVLEKPFAGLKQRVRFHHTGHNDMYPFFADKVGLDRSDVVTLPMVGPAEYPSHLPFDIGVVPLSKFEFNDAKSWIKGLEYAAAGIPFVASPSHEYLRLKKQFGIGRIARSSKEWIQHIEELCDFDVRVREAEQQRRIVEEHFDVKKMARAWDEIARDPFGFANQL